MRLSGALYPSYFKRSIFRTFATDAPKPFKDLPGLNALPVIGTVHHFLPLIGSIRAQKNISGIFTALNEKFGPIVKWDGMFGRPATVLFFDPKDYEKVHRAEESNPMRPGFQALAYYREVRHKEKYEGIYGLTTSQGTQWREFRTKLNPVVLKVNLGRLYSAGLEEIADESIARLLKMSPKAITEDFDSEIAKWSLESIGLIALGSRIGCLEDHSEADHPSKTLLACLKNIADLAYKLEFSPDIWKADKSDTPDFKQLLDVFETQFSVTEKFIKQAKQRIEQREPELPPEDQSILDKLLAIDENTALLTANEFVQAGVDTVAFTATGLLYQLAVNQEAQDKVREEIVEQKGARYFKACLKESLRMASVVPSNARLTTKEHVVGGYQIPKGVFAIAPNEVISQSEHHYPQGSEFIPERWLVGKSHPLYHGNTHPMVTLPFGFGVRACIGRRISELEVEVFVRRLLRDQRVTWSGPPIQITSKLMNVYTKPFGFKFEAVN